jgi:hypothetical protein
MNITAITVDSQPSVITKSNRVMGVVESSNALEALTPALTEFGVTEIETLSGVTGAKFLSDQEHSFQGLLDRFLGDMESKMRATYSKAIQEGHLVFAVPTTAENKDAVLRIVTESGAKYVVSYGSLINESHGPL